MQALFETQKIILSQFQKETLYRRAIFEALTLDNYITGVVGSRGVGKTTILLDQAIQNGALRGEALYVSADQLFFVKNTLLELVDQLYKETNIRLLCVDEIHKADAWTQQLKNIADIYPSFRILFSGSSVIDLVHGQYDLSRRVTLHTLHGFSFREFLEFRLTRSFPVLAFDSIEKDHLAFAQALQLPQVLKHFQEYLQTGYYPFFKQLKEDWEKFQMVEHITQKTIYEDIGTFKSLKTSSLMVMEKLFKYVLNSPPGELSAYKLANALGKDFESVSDQLSLLEQAGLIRFLWPKAGGKAALRNPAKIYPDNTNLIYASHIVPIPEDSLMGKVRETFVLNHLQNKGIPVHYTDVGDFQTDSLLFEVGGKNKTLRQLKAQPNAKVLADGILLGDAKTIPLYLLGFLI